MSSDSFALRLPERRGRTALVPGASSADSPGAAEFAASSSFIGSPSVEGLVEVLARGESGNSAIISSAVGGLVELRPQGVLWPIRPRD